MLAKALSASGRSTDFSIEAGQVRASGTSGFEERLTREILQSERTRMLILAGLSGALATTFPVFALVSRQDYARIFGTAWTRGRRNSPPSSSVWPPTSWSYVR